MPLPTQHHQHTPSTTSSLNHPHPLRSHRSSKDVLATSPKDPASPHPSTLGVRRSSPDDHQRGYLQRTSGETHFVAPITSVLETDRAAEEGFRDSARVGAGGCEVREEVVRPPLRPMVSFGGVSQVSYYSVDEPILGMKEMRVEELGVGKSGRDWRFYGCFACLGLLNFACDVSITGFSTALPTVSKDFSLTAVQTVWIPGSLLLSAATAQPLFMRLSAALGCKSLLLFSIVLFTMGSILAAYSHDSTLLIAGRCLEGVGIGGIGILTQLTLNQIGHDQGHPAHHRKILSRAASHLFWMGIAAGPIIGGACAETMGWRKIFWIQISIGLFGLITLPFLLRLPYIEGGSVGNRLLKVDFIGWLLLSGSLTSIVLAIPWAGTQHSWTSYHVMLPLALGILVLPFWCLYNRYRIEAILPVSIFRNASAATACFGTFMHGAILAAIIYLIPILLQIQGLNELMSGLSLAPWTFSIVAFGILSGAIQSLSGYRWAIWTGWGFATLGIGLMILFKETTSAAVCAPIGLIGGIALGMLLPSQATAIESTASTDDETIHATSLHHYLTTLGHSFGVLIGSSIFLNNLQTHVMHNSYLSSNAANYITDAISMVKVLIDLPSKQSGLQSDLITAYTASLRPVWIIATALAGLAFLLSFWFLEDHTPPQRRP